ncbi:MAG: flagellar export chaperone FliS [Deltaproteobacteria bacterium]|jgi:flagellar protein FliS|nr:flagellar export chaperone FliS [Deltaproteobacteria bacterium]MDA8157752.1 flagellar export chaperone FliS [Deltaproteobacteria bacterium]
MNDGISKYENINVSTVDQGTLIIMAYEGAINFVKEAKAKLAQNDYAGKSINISNAVSIINELNARLNMEKGGETAKNLNKLYTFLSIHLTTANLKKDAHKLDESLNILQNLLNGWKIIVEKDKKQNAVVSDVNIPLNAESIASGISNMPAAGGITVAV